MDYIIDPMLFYSLHISGIAKIVFGIAAFVLFGCLCASVGSYIYNKYQIISFQRQDYKACIKEHTRYKDMCKYYMYISGILTIIFLLLFIFIPSKTVCIEMIVAKNITTETIEGGIETLKYAVDYVIDKLQMLQ